MSLMAPFLFIAAASSDALVKLRAAEMVLSQMPQVDLATEHVLHAGMYARTIRLDAGVVITGALIKIPTLLVFNGVADVLVGEQWLEIKGYGVIPAPAGRKQAFITRSELDLTMIFPTQAKTVEEAENEFTDEAPLLMSRRSTSDVVLITGE